MHAGIGRNPLRGAEMSMRRPFPQHLAVEILVDDLDIERRGNAAGGGVPVVGILDDRHVVIAQYQVVDLGIGGLRHLADLVAVAVVEEIAAGLDLVDEAAEMQVIALVREREV